MKYYGGVFSVKVGVFKVYSSEKKKKDEGYIKVPKLKFDDIKIRYKLAKEIYHDEKHEVISLLKETQRRLDFKLFNISITFGFGDAAITGIANGFIWGGITGIVSILKRYMDIENKTNIAVYPHYTESCFETDVCLVFETRIIKMFGINKRVKQLYKRNKCKIKRLAV